MRKDDININITINKNKLIDLIFILGFILLIILTFKLECLRYKQSIIVITIADFSLLSYIQYITLRWIKETDKFYKIRYLTPLFMSVVLTLYSLYNNFNALDPANLNIRYEEIFLWGAYHLLISLVFTSIFLFIKNILKKYGRLK